MVLLHRFRDRALPVGAYDALTEVGIEVIALPGRRRWVRSWFGDLVVTVDDVTAVHALVSDLT